MGTNLKIGVLTLQGDSLDHIRLLKKIENVTCVEVRVNSDLQNIDGIIIPGGESTVISKLMKERKMFEILQKKIEEGFFAFGTCAGSIILSSGIEIKKEADKEILTLDAIDCKIDRNSYGSQIESFSKELYFEPASRKIKVFFIRAPRITYFSEKVKVMMEFNKSPVLIRQNNVLSSTFHSEIEDDITIHQYFVDMIRGEI